MEAYICLLAPCAKKLKQKAEQQRGLVTQAKGSMFRVSAKSAGANALACARAGSGSPARSRKPSRASSKAFLDATRLGRERERQRACLARASTELPSVSKEEDEDEGRVSFVERKTKETSVFVKINIDGTGKSDCDSGVPFLDHMLDVSSDGQRERRTPQAIRSHAPALLSASPLCSKSRLTVCSTSR